MALLKPKQVADELNIPHKSVYTVHGLPWIRLGPRTLRMDPDALRDYIHKKEEAA